MLIDHLTAGFSLDEFLETVPSTGSGPGSARSEIGRWLAGAQEWRTDEGSGFPILTYLSVVGVDIGQWTEGPEGARRDPFAIIKTRAGETLDSGSRGSARRHFGRVMAAEFRFGGGSK